MQTHPITTIPIGAYCTIQHSPIPVIAGDIRPFIRALMAVSQDRAGDERARANVEAYMQRNLIEEATRHE